MYARNNTMQGDASKLDALLTFFREQGLPAIRQQPGCKGTRFLADRRAGKVRVVTLWETAEAAEAGEVATRQLRAQGAATFGASAPTLELFEVLVAEDF